MSLKGETHYGFLDPPGNRLHVAYLRCRYRQLYDKQYNFERNQFINPGEDFTPEPAISNRTPSRLSNL